MTRTPRVVKLTVVTDFICANCFVVEHELLDAISTCKDTLQLPLSFELEHIPYKLVCPSIFKENEPIAITKEEFLKKYIGPEKLAKVDAAIAKWAEEKGIPISFRGVMSQSTLAHRLCQKAFNVGGQDMQISLLLAVFKAYLQEAKDIGDIDILSDLAEQTNVMPKSEAVAFLKSNELETEVTQLCDRTRRLGITGVPVVIIDGKWLIKGGHSSEVFVQIFKKLAICNGSSSVSCTSSGSDSFAVIDTLSA
jgi:predicted DsbA family dithiol-disulfide isomerase